MMRTIALLLAVALSAGCGKKDDDKASKPAVQPPVKPAAPTTPEPPPPPRAALGADPGGAAGDHQWSVSFGALGADEPRAVALTPDGGTVVTGIFSKTVNFGPGEMTAESLDVFVVKLDKDGKTIWAALIGGGAEDIPADIAVDAQGNVVVVGWFSGKMIVGETTLMSNGGDDAFVVKFDKEGKPAWARKFGGDSTDVAQSVAIDPRSGDIVITGDYRNTVNFGAGPRQSKGNADIFLLRLGPDGTHQWSKSIGDLGQDYGRSVEIDSRGDIVLAAEFTTEVDFGTGKPLAHKGNRDLAVAKYRKDGTCRWAKSYGNTFDEIVVALALDPADNIVIGGSFERKLVLGNETLVSKGRKDAFVAAFDPAGEPRWARSWGADRNDQVNAVAVDAFGNVVATGWFVAKVDFGGGALESPNGNQDVFLLKLDKVGGHVWSRRFGDRDNDRGRALAMAADGAITLTGKYRFNLSFAGNTLESAHKSGAKIAPADIFVARFSP